MATFGVSGAVTGGAVECRFSTGGAPNVGPGATGAATTGARANGVTGSRAGISMPGLSRRTSGGVGQRVWELPAMRARSSPEASGTPRPPP